MSLQQQLPSSFYISPRKASEIGIPAGFVQEGKRKCDCVQADISYSVLVAKTLSLYFAIPSYNASTTAF
jgi:hypothetical protein